MFITCTCDPAGEGEDFTAIIVCGIDKNKNIYVLEAVNDHLKPDKITDKIMTLNFKWKFDRFAVETNYFRGTLEQDLKLSMKEYDGNANFKHFSIEPITASSSRRTFSKILGLQPYHERKQIYLPGKDFYSLSKVYSELAYRMIQFTIDGSKSPHDDLLCALSMQLDIISAGGEAKVKEPPETSAAWIEKQVITEMQGNRRKIPLRYRQTYEPVFYNQ
jgi:predicted phage terminase large subunit-like protein